MNPVSAGGYTSAAAYIGLAFIVFLWLHTVMKVVLASAVTAAVVTLQMIFSDRHLSDTGRPLGRVVVDGVLCHSERAIASGDFYFGFAILARPVAIIALAAVLCALVVWRRDWVGCLFGAILGGIFIAATQGRYSWATLNASYIRCAPLGPASVRTRPVARRLCRYLSQAAAPYSGAEPLYDGHGPCRHMQCRHPDRPIRSARYSGAPFICIAGIAGHWAIFPVAAPRYVAFYYLAIIVILLASLTAALNDDARLRRRGI